LVTGGTLPSVTVTSPPSTTSSSPLTVSGTASGPSPITQVTWSNAATGKSGTANGTSSWSATIPLAPGSNTITITVTDSTGTSNSSTFTVNYVATSPSTSGGGGRH